MSIFDVDEILEMDANSLNKENEVREEAKKVVKKEKTHTLEGGLIANEFRPHPKYSLDKKSYDCIVQPMYIIIPKDGSVDSSNVENYYTTIANDKYKI